MTRRSTPWGTIIGVAVVVLFAAGIFGYAYVQQNRTAEAASGLARFVPTETNPDPSNQIAGVVVQKYAGGQHVPPQQQVAYTHSPPFGGAHDGFWAACNGVVYPNPVRSENLVHSLEHGAVWITYNPDQVSGPALETLASKVEGEQYMVMSPYPGLDSPISLQSWDHQLKLTDAADPRIDEFITALRGNRFTHPEVGASCDALGAPRFDQDNPPAYAPAPAVGTPGAAPEVLTTPPSGAPAPTPAP